MSDTRDPYDPRARRTPELTRAEQDEVQRLKDEREAASAEAEYRREKRQERDFRDAGGKPSPGGSSGSRRSRKKPAPFDPQRRINAVARFIGMAEYVSPGSTVGRKPKREKAGITFSIRYPKERLEVIRTFGLSPAEICTTLLDDVYDKLINAEEAA